jgi:EAL domain-containing protein (putative c-di-GMP-specific phosphodiesterase class I)
MSLEVMQFEVGASIGIALSPDHGTEPQTLMKRADLAMYDAKTTGTSTCVFEPTHDFTSARRLELASGLRQALARGDIDVVVQPQVDTASLATVSVEALARWTDPVLGTISPVEFVPVAERSGLIGPLTMAVLEKALTAAAQWGTAGVAVAVNLSPRSLLDPSLVDDVAGALERAGVAPSSLVLEVTEGAVMTDPDRAIALLSRFQAMGVRLSIDDFGTGYSSLAYLKRLPVHEVKIDRSFVTSLATSEPDRAIVRSIINLADNLGLEVVAEGVEDAEALELLAAMGCTRVQGWHLARPMPLEAVNGWLADRGPVVAARGGARTPA